jgi:hypothetical protein
MKSVLPARANYIETIINILFSVINNSIRLPLGKILQKVFTMKGSSACFVISAAFLVP